MSQQGVETLKQIVYQASRLCQENLNHYGQKGSRPGTPGYVKDGFQNAVWDATQEYYRMTGKSLSQAAIRRREIGTVAHRLRNNEKQLQLYCGFKIKLEQLKSKYWNAGLKIQAVQPAKQRKKSRLCKKEDTTLTGSM